MGVGGARASIMCQTAMKPALSSIAREYRVCLCVRVSLVEDGHDLLSRPGQVVMTSQGCHDLGQFLTCRPQYDQL